jgi:DNA-binding MarR family transcriptional regulator
MSHITELSKSRATLRVLQFLSKEGEAKITSMVGQIAGQRGIYTALNTLLKLGLAKERIGEEFPHPRLISLTEAGLNVAKSLNTIEAAVNQSVSINICKKGIEDSNKTLRDEDILPDTHT